MITFEMLETEVRRLAAEHPDFRYPQPDDSDVVPAEHPDFRYPQPYDGDVASANCVYNATADNPACIFGQAMANLDHPIHPDYEGKGITAVLASMLNLYLSERQERWASNVQMEQDRGIPWSQAVQSADICHPLEVPTCTS